jgi:hypothetical protein
MSKVHPPSLPSHTREDYGGHEVQSFPIRASRRRFWGSQVPWSLKLARITLNLLNSLSPAQDRLSAEHGRIKPGAINPEAFRGDPRESAGRCDIIRYAWKFAHGRFGGGRVWGISDIIRYSVLVRIAKCGARNFSSTSHQRKLQEKSGVMYR